MTFTNLPANEPGPAIPFEYPHAHEVLAGHVHAGWESMYFSEGRDSLDGDSLFYSSFEFGLEHFTGGIWYGSSPNQTYDEMRLAAAVTEKLDDYEFYLGLTHLQFASDDTDDNEIGAGLARSNLPYDLEITFDAYFSMQADGAFSEVSLSRSFSMNENLNLTATGIYGINHGYISDGHDGSNHIAAQIGMAYSFTESIALIAYTTYSWALRKQSFRPGDAQLNNSFHGAVGFELSF